MENKQCDYHMYAHRVVECLAPTSLSFHSWQPPVEGWIKATFDAHIGTDFNRGLGVALRHKDGN